MSRWTHDEVRSEVIAVTQHLIGIESHCEAPTQESELIAWISQYLSVDRYKTATTEIEPNRPNLIAYPSHARESSKPIVALVSHSDTVPALTMREAFTPSLEGDHLRGRGAVDMKGGLATHLVAMRILAETNRDTPYEVNLVCLADEEQRARGGQLLAENAEYHADFAIVSEPTNLALATAHRRMEWTRVTLTGRAAHGSMPAAGVDANLAASRFVCALDEAQRQGPPHPVLGRRTFNPGVVHGGAVTNMVSDECTVDIDCRTLPGDTSESIESFYRHLLSEIQRSHSEDFGYSIARMTWACGQHPPLATPSDHWGVVGLLESSANFGMINPSPTTFPGWSDAANMQRLGIPAAVFGPGLLSRAHSAEESVSLRDLTLATEILVHFLSGGEL